MTKINCWNEYDSLKTVILGSVFDNDKIPQLYEGRDQESFHRIVEETNEELTEFQTILEQNGATVLRPSQPKNYNNLDIVDHSPLINMRDFYMAYDNMFFMTYGSYKTRRFQHAWVEDIVNQFILDGNLVLSSNEPNLNNDEAVNYEELFASAEDYFELLDIPYPKKSTHVKFLANDHSNKNYFELDWYRKYQYTYKNKNLFHTATLLKHNDKCFISSYCGTPIGKKWITTWLEKIGVTPIYIPHIAHIDGICNILNKDSIIASKYATTITDHFKNVFRVDRTEEIDTTKFDKGFIDKLKNPTSWLYEWQGYFQKFDLDSNVFTINPHTVALSFYDKDFYAKLKNHGIEAIYVKWKNAPFWSGGLHCITCDVERRPE